MKTTITIIVEIESKDSVNIYTNDIRTVAEDIIRQNNTNEKDIKINLALTRISVVRG